MPKGLIVEKHAGFDIPEEYLKKAMKDYPNAFGGVIHAEDKGKHSLLVSLLDSGIPMDDIRAAMKDYHDQKAVFFFGDFPQGYRSDDIQPFIVLSDKADVPLLVAFMEGDFKPFSKGAGAEHSDEYYAFDEMLRPTFEELFQSEAVGRDMDKLMNVIDHDKKLTRTMRLMCAERGVVTLMAVNGNVRRPVNENKLFATYNWGTTSNSMGYEDPKASDAIPAKKGFLKRVLGTEKKAEPAAMPVDNPLKAEPQKIVEKPKTETIIPAGASNVVNAVLHEREKATKLSGKVMSAPPKLAGRPLKNWCHNHLGYVPQNWQQHGVDGFVLTAFVANSKLTGVKDAPIKSFADPKLANAIGSKPAEDKKDAVPLTASERRRRALALAKDNKEPAKVEPAKVEPKIEPKPDVKPSPAIIPTEELKGLAVWQTKFKAYDGTEIVIDPEVMASLTEEVPDYAEQTGRKGLEFVFYLSQPEIQDHITKFPVATGVLIRNLINLLADSYSEQKAEPAQQQRKAG